MEERNGYGEKLLIYSEYPHNLMQHILTLLRSEGKKTEWLITDESMKKYSERFSNNPGEIKELLIAGEKGILKGFWDNRKAQENQKNTFIQNSLMILMKDLKEYEAVELLESLMWVFGWEISVEVTRKWNVSDDERANFHNFDELEAYQRDRKKKAAEKQEEKEEAPQTVFKTEVRAENKPSPAQENGQEKKEDEKTLRRGSRVVRKRSTTGSGKAAPKASPQEDFELQDILEMNVLPEEEYRRLLGKMQIKYENLMHLSLRKEIRRAKRGNALSQIMIAEFYSEEDTKHTDFWEAAKWYSFAVRQGNDKAKLELGKLLDGEKLSENVKKGSGITSTKRFGIQYFKELAEKEYPTAQSILGMKYYFGDGVKKNAAKGIHWLKKAAAQGQIEAQRQLGEIYADVDTDESVRWLRMASAAGDSLAKSRLK